MNTTTTVVLIAVSSANLLTTLAMARAMLKAKQNVEREVAVVRASTNRSLSKLKNALEDLEV